MSLFGTLQTEVGEWSQNNFGDQPAVNPLLGVVEELGELSEDLDLVDAPDEDELDAIGDMLVFMADFCARHGLDYQAAADEAQNITVDVGADGDGLFREASAGQGGLCHSVLKQRQGIRLEDSDVGVEAEQSALAQWIATLDAFATVRGYTLEECIDVAWYDEVINREWDSTYTN